MVLGRNGNGKNHDQAEPELTPEEEYDAVIRDVIAWVGQLRVLETRQDAAEHALKMARRYPIQAGTGGIFAAADTFLRWCDRYRPELVGKPPLPSRERQSVSDARTDLAHAEEMFGTVKARLAAWREQDGEGLKSTYTQQARDWLRTLKQRRAHVAQALRSCPDVTPAELAEAEALTEDQEQTVTLTF